MISIIVAIAKNFAIGLNNELLYKMPNDMKHFKEITTGHTILMGKNTFASFPKRPLPGRRNVVLALPKEIPDDKEGAEWFTSLEAALEATKNDGEIFVVGGAYVYEQCLNLADKLYLTIVNDEPLHADAFFPVVNFDEWQVISREEHSADDKHKFPFAFVELIRK
ncbi:MAG: dihydrofolate reductase [Prevotellaceae bacterium]|nr:dihydrofolate reductase [Candidatus Colivivens equi]MCQ2076861.1 dihydrofolate reductase [Bacteroidaceae bacterium]